MPFASFIARRMLRDGNGGGTDRFARPIIAIAVGGVAVGMAVMIITVGSTAGFQGEVRAKTIGAGGHLQIAAIAQTDPKESVRVPIAQPFYPWLDTVPGVAHIQVFATKPGIIEADEGIEGVVVKGVGADHDWRFLRAHLKTGDVPAIGDTLRPIDMLVSVYLSNRLRIGVDDTVTVYLVRGREDIRPRRFRVCGLYETGLEQVDRQVVYVDIGHLQRFAQWGLKAEIAVDDTVAAGGIRIEGLAFGGDRAYRYHWPGTELHGKGPHWVRTDHDTTITLVVGDLDHTLPDTAWVRIVPKGPVRAGPWLRRDEVDIARGGSGGSHVRYCGGFEVALDRYEDIRAMDDLVYQRYLPIELRSLSILDRFPEIFSWLELLDTNVLVIVILMVVVATINMASALLILILERTPMVGTLKALGATDGSIQGIFLLNAAHILVRGVLLGDALGIGLCLLQQHTGLVTLPVETYYVEAVPIALEARPLVLLNLGTIAVCLVALVLPSTLVARIAPAQAIRFD